MRLINKEIERIVAQALKEDIGSGDITTNSIIAKKKKAIANFYAKNNGVVAGLKIAKSVFKKLDNKILWKNFVDDGDKVTAGTKIASIKGSYRSLLTGERAALNILQRASGVATLTSTFVENVKGTNAKILDTRKTAPGLRLLDKYAVKTGGGNNHRIGLFDMVLIKDNHIEVAGGIKEAVKQVRKHLRNKILIEVETSTLEQVKEALESKVDIIMLDNMNNEMMIEAVQLANGMCKVEASGNVSLENVLSIAETGVDFISVGALTHSVKAFDINMKFEKTKEAK